MNNANSWTALQQFGAGASTSVLSASNGVSTTTISGAGVQTASISVTGAATSTFANGLSITTGCFSMNGTCLNNLGLGANSWTGLQTFGTGYISNGSSTVVGAFTNTGLAVHGGGFISQASSTVVGALTTTGSGSFGGNLGVGTSTPWGNLSISSSNSSVPELIVGSTTVTSFFVGNSGNVGIGTSTPNANFVLNGTISSAGGNIFQVASSTNQNIVVINNNGNVGIGTAASSQALTVNGNINVAAGKCFMVNGTCIGYITKLSAIYATTTAGTSTVAFSGLPNSNPSWNAGALTIQSNVSYYNVEGWGGGGGGGGYTVTTAGMNGSSTCYAQNSVGACVATALLTAAGGSAGVGGVTGASGAGGTVANSRGELILAGGAGLQGNTSTGGNAPSISGGSSPRGGEGGLEPDASGAGGAGAAPGGGGAGGHTTSGGNGGSGGAGAYAMNIATTSVSTASVLFVGPGGQGGTGTYTGGVGGSGGIVITIYATSSPNATGNDYAELYPVSNPQIGAGDIVSVDNAAPVQMRLAQSGDTTLAGVISTQPGEVLGDQSISSERPVALSGRVPVKVNLENGPIAIGDRIAVSSQPGIGMKAGPFDDSVGIALTSYDGSESDATVTVFLDLQKASDIDAIAFGLLDRNPAYFGLDASSTESTLSSSPLDFVGAMMNAIASRLTSFAGTSGTSTSATSTGFSLYKTLASLSGVSANASSTANSNPSPSQSALASLSVIFAHATTSGLTVSNATSGIVSTDAQGNVGTASIDCSLTFAHDTISLNLSHQNIWVGLQQFSSASTSLFESALEYAHTIQSTSTALVLQSGISSTAGLTIGSTSTPQEIGVDTLNNRVRFGTGAGQANPILAIFDTGNAGDPLGVNGAVYYNSNIGAFRCYGNGAWRDCGGEAASSTGDIQFTNTDGSFGANDNFNWNIANNGLTVRTTAGQTGNAITVASSSGAELVGGTSGGVLQIASTTDPVAPTDNVLDIYAKDIAGRIVPTWMSASGAITPLQSSLGFSRVAMVVPSNTLSTTAVGTTPSNSGKLSIPALASTNLLTSARRIAFSTTATAGSVAGQRQNALMVWRGNAPGLGGFFYTVRFGTPKLQSGNHAFIGLSDSVAAPTDIDPLGSSATGEIGVAIDDATGNWQFVSNMAGMIPTVSDLGSGFSINTTDLYELVLYSPPDGTTVSWRVSDLSTGTITTGVATANIPEASTFLAPQFWISNAATPGIATLDFGGWYLESDN